MNYDTLDADVVKILPKHFTKGRGGKKVTFIGIHYNAGNLTVEGCYNVWETRKASAHYQVEASGRIGQLVWDSNTAWALGNFAKNQQSINIEHANRPDGTITEACLDAGAHLVAALCKHYGLGRPQWDVNVIPHCKISPTSCPGQIYKSQKNAYIQRAQYWYDIMTGAAQPKPEPKPEPPKPPKPPLPEALAGYSDLDSEAWYINTLEKAVKAGYIKGYSNGTMGPNDPCTRAQAVCMIANASGFEAEHPYSDVVASPYYYDAVEWAKEQGIINGELDQFRPNDSCSRQEFAAMLFNWKGTEPVGEPAGYSDWSDVADWAKPSMAWAVEKGVVSGYAGKLRPNDACTRAEAASMLVNLLQ